MTTLGYLALGVDEVQRLSLEKNLVLDLTMPEIIGLGRAVYDRYMAKGHDLVLDPVGLAILNQIAEERSLLRPTPPELQLQHRDPVRYQELLLVLRANACLVECHSSGRLDACPYRGLALDQKYGLGRPILHLDPARVGADPEHEPETDKHHDNAQGHQGNRPEDPGMGSSNGVHRGRVVHTTRGSQNRHVRNMKIEGSAP
jgi:hypothetical protein